MQSSINAAVVVGVGYVGLQWAELMHWAGLDVLGLDTSSARRARLRREAPWLPVVSTAEGVPAGRHLWLIAVPTPVTADHRPDDGPLFAAVAEVLAAGAPGDLVILTSTVALASLDAVIERLRTAGLRPVHVPERMSPGESGVTAQVHLVGADDPADADEVEALLARLGVRSHRVGSPTVAALAKLLENTRRDVNIALLNEFAAVAAAHGVSVHEVVDAASTKVGFEDARFVPGFVGGHCVAVDPWLFVNGAGAHGRVATAARVANDAVPALVAGLIDPDFAGAEVLVVGATFKPNCPDVRNAGAAVLARLLAPSFRVTLLDPTADAEAFAVEFPDLTLTTAPPASPATVVVVAVTHAWVTPELVRSCTRPGGLVVDPWRAVPEVMNDELCRYVGL